MSDYTTATAILEALESAGVTHLYVNIGSDHPAFLEAISKRQTEKTQGSLQVFTAPNEFVGLSAAQGFFQATGRMQAVLVHVDAGTLAMAGAIHNVSRARIPVIMIAGTSPVTEEGELTGTRNEFIHYLQDTIDQRGIVRGYTVLDQEIRTGRNAKQLVLRAAQFSKSDPQGPSYLIASREALEENITPYTVDERKWKPLAPRGLAPVVVDEIVASLISAKSPVVVTTYLGRDTEAVAELIKLCESLGVAVLEALPAYMNFPHDHCLYAGNHWSEGLPNGILDNADVVLVLDCDVPWIKSVFRPSKVAKVYHIDCDPLKVNMSLFHIDVELSCQADMTTALRQLNSAISKSNSISAQVVQARIGNVTSLHDTYIDKVRSMEAQPATAITPHFALSRLREHLTPDTIVLSEAISNYRPTCDVLMRSQPGTYLTSGATALGWHGGAAIGVAMAHPSRLVVAVTGDGSFMFSIPSTVHWMARRYDAPFLTVILNNRGWKSPMLSALAVHKNGYSSRMVQADDLHVTFDPSCDHSQVAVAAGAGWGTVVKEPNEVDAAIAKGIEVVRSGRAAVVDIWLPKFNIGDRVG
ncbi:acetolactate synthase [Fusarium tjaetaba]|uniref:Acetolactate synthase n=1 Tax=Fusarium tjaetaba TaxID=1567544 RepID=A0A8H5S6I5_9HYPO|nr:acetolactate synthase [Fusarium tjaetaba]KAF5646123.1 acetolactate synthase [Fusarium tjaetaba]